MTTLISYVVLLSITLSSMSADKKEVVASTPAVIVQPAEFQVHVLLEQKPATETSLWIIKSSAGFILTDPLDESCSEIIEADTLTFDCHQKFLTCNKKRLTRNAVKVAPRLGELHMQTQQYPGTFLVVKDAEECFLINNVHLEDYVCGVLRAESWPGWPIEVNRAFAIMQRSYVVAHILKARKKNSGKKFLYDVGCTNKFQTYKGSHQFEVLRQAVEDTAGIILAYDKQPIIAMYDTCCGSLIPSKMKDLKKTATPYLARSYPCLYCKGTKVYQWKASYTHQEFEALLQEHNKHLKNIQKIKISHTDEAGIVHEIKFLCGKAKRWIAVSGKELYKIFKDTKSFCYELEKQAEHYVFSGTGYGHHLGVCQWGARQMVREGFSYKDILMFYYPGAYFMRLEFV